MRAAIASVVVLCLLIALTLTFGLPGVIGLLTLGVLVEAFVSYEAYE